MISGDYFKNASDFIANSFQELINWPFLKEDGRLIFIKSSKAEEIFKKILNSTGLTHGRNTFLLHGDDDTISEATAREITSLGYKIKSVNWLGNSSLVEPLPIGLPTPDRLPMASPGNIELFSRKISEYRLQAPDRHIYLYSNFDITTNLPIRKRALLAALQIKDSFTPITRIEMSSNLDILSKSKYVLSPPGAGPDCFRTWEAIYLGAIPIVLQSHWPFNHLDLPVLVVDSFDELEQKIAVFESNGRVHNKSWENYFLLP